MAKRRSDDNGPLTHTPLPGQQDLPFEGGGSGGNEVLEEGPIPVDRSPRILAPEHGPADDEDAEFDPDRIRMPTDYATIAGIKAAALQVAVFARPPKTAFFRVHPENEIKLLFLDLSEQDSDALYWVDWKLQPALLNETTVKPRLIVQCQTRQGTNFLWPVKIRGPLDRQESTWTRSAMKEIQLGRRSWIRHRSNLELKEYEPLIAPGIEAEPNWPDVPFKKILKAALADRHITSLDHDVLRALLKGK